MLGHQALELRHESWRCDPAQVRLNAPLEGDDTKLFEPHDRRLGEGLVREVIERRPAPELERLVQFRRGRGGVSLRKRPAGVLGQALEAGEIELIGPEVDPVAGLGAENRLERIAR